MEKPDNIEKELREISPELAGISREDGFPVREDYFQDLPGRVQEKIRNQAMPGRVVRGHVFGPKTLKWIAASIAILILASGYYYKAWKSFDPGNYTNSESYVIENFDEATITEYLTEISSVNETTDELIDNTLGNIDEEIIIEEL
jgi:hypothetical protein